MSSHRRQKTTPNQPPPKPQASLSCSFICLLVGDVIPLTEVWIRKVTPGCFPSPVECICPRKTRRSKSTSWDQHEWWWYANKTALINYFHLQFFLNLGKIQHLGRHELCKLCGPQGDQGKLFSFSMPDCSILGEVLCCPNSNLEDSLVQGVPFPQKPACWFSLSDSS